MTGGKLPPGTHPGFQNLKQQPGVNRCRLWPVVNKRDPKHADYKGVLQLSGSKAPVLIGFIPMGRSDSVWREFLGGLRRLRGC